jgi:alkylated DNA nucleotide flippase Atl1
MAEKKKKSWLKKLKESKGLPRVAKITGKLTKRWGKGTVAIPAPMEVNEIMRKVPKGKIITINEIRKIVAKKHKATIGCPITCGIFAWISANAAEEERSGGKKEITPYWRTLKSDGTLNEKYPGGTKNQKKLLEKEGHKVVQKGKKYLVADFQKYLAKLAYKK